MTPWLLAFGIGFVSGLRAFTGLAALALTRGGVWGIVLSIVAIGEYVADALPNIPPRTGLPSIVLRPLTRRDRGLVHRVVARRLADRRRDPRDRRRLRRNVRGPRSARRRDREDRRDPGRDR